jgi:hypothetical protein
MCPGHSGHEYEPKAARPTPGSADLCLITDMPRLHGWIIRDVECVAALRTWLSLVERHGEETLTRRVRAEPPSAG